MKFYNQNMIEDQGGWITWGQEFNLKSGQHGKTPSLLKIQKLAGHGDTHLYSQLLGRLRQEKCLNPGGGGCSEQRSHCSLCNTLWNIWLIITQLKKQLVQTLTLMPTENPTDWYHSLSLITLMFRSVSKTHLSTLN